jgi:hypothetical protein
MQSIHTSREAASGSQTELSPSPLGVQALMRDTVNADGCGCQVNSFGQSDEWVISDQTGRVSLTLNSRACSCATSTAAAHSASSFATRVWQDSGRLIHLWSKAGLCRGHARSPRLVVNGLPFYFRARSEQRGMSEGGSLSFSLTSDHTQHRCPMAVSNPSCLPGVSSHWNLSTCRA